MPDLQDYTNWKVVRGKEGSIAFQRIHILPGLCFHRIVQNSNGTIIHYYVQVDNDKFDVVSDGPYYKIQDNTYIPPDVNNTENKSSLRGVYSDASGNDMLFGVGSFKIVEAKSDQGRPYDFT